MSAPTKVTEYENGTKIEFVEKGHKYTVNGEKNYTSVTKILDMFDKPQLVAWGQNVGAHGVLKLAAHGYDLAALLGSTDETVDEWKAAGSRDATFDLLKAHELRTWDVTKKAQDRGIDTHAALEEFGRTGAVPALADYDPEVRPYVQGLAAFLIDADPQIVGSEIMVASTEHKFVGTFDMRFVMGARELVTDMETGERQAFQMGTYLADAKTGKAIYDEALEQLAGYELASIECGYAPTDGRLVVRFAEGKYEVKQSFVSPETFAVYADAYHARQAAKDAQTDGMKAVAA